MFSRVSRLLWRTSPPTNNRGLIIAVVGGDGAGKSTVVKNLYDWLAQTHNTMRVHMGRPAWSRATLLVRATIKFGRIIGLLTSTEIYLANSNVLPEDVKPTLPWMLRMVCTARDRQLTFMRMQKFAQKGGVVLCDRFPLPEIKLMDGPQISRAFYQHQHSRLSRWLATKEKSYYEQLIAPDLLFVLKLDPEIAVKRKFDEEMETVRLRSAEIWQTQWHLTPYIEVDASQTEAEVYATLEAAIENRLTTIDQSMK